LISIKAAFNMGWMDRDYSAAKKKKNWKYTTWNLHFQPQKTRGFFVSINGSIGNFAIFVPNKYTNKKTIKIDMLKSFRYLRSSVLPLILIKDLPKMAQQMNYNHLDPDS
jgi:hypothetical protein